MFRLFQPFSILIILKVKMDSEAIVLHAEGADYWRETQHVSF